MRPLRSLVALLGLLAVCACSMDRVVEREQFWVKAAGEHLPPGTSRADATRFLAAHGLVLRCCVNGPDIVQASMAREPGVGRALLVDYDVVLLLDFSNDDRLERVRVQRWGVGF